MRVVQIVSNGNSFKCFKDGIIEPPETTREVHFVKLDNVDIELENMQDQVIVSSIKENAMSSLYAVIAKIYVPLLSVNDKSGDKNNQLRDLLY